MNMRIAAGLAALLACASAAALEVRRGAFADAQAARQRPTLSARGDNPIEPISNGVALNMSRDEVKRRFGEPGRRAGFPSCVMHFHDFTVETCGQEKRVERLYLSGTDVRLSSGLGIGSSMGEVAQVLGNPSGGELGPYRIGVAYRDDRVSSIKIDYDSHALSGQSDSSRSNDASGNLAGMYFCVAPRGCAGTIRLQPDGTYTQNGKGGGRWRAGSREVRFDGQLRSWNDGVARLENGNLIFEWKNAEGWKQYFAYRKGS